MKSVPRDPIRSLEWAPDAGVAYEPDQKPAAALEQPQQQVALTADASSGAAAAGAAADPADATSAILAKRRAHLGPNMTLFFQDEPLHIVRGSGCRLYDAEEASYLDCISNVQHVGHAHPGVATAVAAQLLALNSNSRFLHSGLADYAEALAGTMPDPLQVVYTTASGSEANDLAWRVARAAAAAAAPGDARPLHVAVVDGAYHGHTSFCIDISPYKWKGPGGGGRPAYVHVLPCPDVYRGQHLDGAAAARTAIAEAEAAGGRLAAFFSESILSCGGQVILPPGYLAGVYGEMRAAGAACVADEVQCGFGRVGAAFWAFRLQGVVPDIVTWGKPAGNGFPLSGLVTSRRLADTFAASGMEYFATFGGCHAATAAGLAVLRVLREERLQDNAARVGAHLLARLRELQAEHPDVIGDVRGAGLMVGIELVTDPASCAPAPALAAALKAACKRRRRVLLSSEGPYASVLKIKPPLCFSEADADELVAALGAALAELGPEERAALAEASRAEVAEVQERHRRLG